MWTVPATINPEKACCAIPTRVHPHLPGLTLNQYVTWLASQKARTLSGGHHRGLCVTQCGGWLTPIFSTLFTIRVYKRHRYCMKKWACRWCRIVKWYTSLQELILIINFVRMGGDSTTNQRQWDHGRRPEANVGQPCPKWPDRLVHQMWTVYRQLSTLKKACCGIPTRVHPHLQGLMHQTAFLSDW